MKKSMKKLLLCLLVCCLGLSLFACREKQANMVLPSAEDMLAAIEASGGFTELTPLSSAQIAKYLNIEESDFTEAAMSMDASRATPEVIVVLTSDVPTAGAGTEWMSEAFFAYETAILEEYRDYQPGEVPKIEDSMYIVHGVDGGTQGILVIGGSEDKVEKAAESLWYRK